jgi:YegS/Rv2252/BmrU family lipid kinase
MNSGAGRIKVILNPLADRGNTGSLKERIPALIAPYGPMDLALTEGPGHAKKLAVEAASAGYDMVVAAGGDGTIHEIVNGLVHNGHSPVRLGVLPLGSANDFAFFHAIPTDLPQAVERLFAGQPRKVDLARIEDDRGRSLTMLNNGGIGFDANIGIENQKITRLHGFAAYMLATLRTIAFYYHTPLLDICFDEERVTARTLMLAIGVGSRAGGGFLLTPNADYDDDRIDTCMISPLGRLAMFALLASVMKGQHLTNRHVTMRANRVIRVTSVEGSPLPVHVDGEIFAYQRDNVRQVTLTSLPGAIGVMV